jgi:hypothetical protein
VGGSGGVAVVPLERGGDCGHFDTCLRVVVAVLAELRRKVIILFKKRCGENENENNSGSGQWQSE